VTWGNEGIYTLRVELVDEHGVKSKEYQFNLIIESKEQIQEIK